MYLKRSCFSDETIFMFLGRGIYIIVALVCQQSSYNMKLGSSSAKVAFVLSLFIIYMDHVSSWNGQ